MVKQTVYLLLILSLYLFPALGQEKELTRTTPYSKSLSDAEHGKLLPAWEKLHLSSLKNFKEPDIDLLNLQQALVLVLKRNPELATVGWDRRIAEAELIQAGLKPNPELELELEEFAGTGDLSGMGSMGTNLRYSHPFELGKKREKRMKVAKIHRDIIDWDYQEKRLDIFTQTAKAYTVILAAQERLALQEEEYKRAKEVLEVVSQRVEAGKVSPLEIKRAGIALSTSGIAVKQTRRKLVAARNQLAAQWDSQTPHFKCVSGSIDLTHFPTFPDLETLYKQIKNNPRMARWETQRSLRQAELTLEKSHRIPDLSLTGGLQRFEENDAFSFTVAVSLPLPLFNRNEGGILAAAHRLARTDMDRQVVAMKIKKELNEIYESFLLSKMEANVLAEEVLPAAKETFAAIQTGYRAGKFHYLDVLDAQRTMFATEGQYIDALEAGHLAALEVKRLIGQSASQKDHRLPALDNKKMEKNKMRNKVLDGAQSVFEASKTGYRQGKLDYLNVLDAQRTLFEAKVQYIEALTSYHTAKADVERLIGRSIDSETLWKK